MTHPHADRVTADDLDHLGDLVPRRARHRLAHHMNRRLHYATTSPERAPYGLRRPYSPEGFAALDARTRIEVVSKHLIEQWIEDGRARRREV